MISKDMDTRNADYLQFFLRIGGGGKDCNGGDHRSEGVILQYSTDGGVTWKLLDELEGTMYGTPRYSFYPFFHSFENGLFQFFSLHFCV